TNPVERAQKLHDRGRYAEALKQLEPFTHPQSVDSKALYYAGRCQFELGNAPAAIPLLDRVIKLGEPAFYEGALWFKANALIQKGDTTRAMLVLDQLLPLRGAYQRKARQLRDQLSR
ncbi:MAG: tetratricopeptide repeat protein, partial [Bacteroidota bacterium]